MHYEVIDIVIGLCLFLGAVLYTSVGHAGASIYIAILTLFGLSAPVIKPTALVMNVCIATFASWRFIKNGFFDFKVLLPVAIGAIPFAFLGGYLNAPHHVYKLIVGAILIVSALSLITPKGKQIGLVTKEPDFLVAVVAGAFIGFLAGLTGTGGGIFLSPLILFLGWSDPKKTSGIAATFILLNSAFGLAGNYASIHNLPEQLPMFVLSTMLGAVIGTTLGIKFYSANVIKKVLALVLFIAGLKLLFT
jgi:uncharacterized membrane protein YfcA